MDFMDSPISHAWSSVSYVSQLANNDRYVEIGVVTKLLLTDVDKSLSRSLVDKLGTVHIHMNRRIYVELHEKKSRDHFEIFDSDIRHKIDITYCSMVLYSNDLQHQDIPERSRVRALF